MPLLFLMALIECAWFVSMDGTLRAPFLFVKRKVPFTENFLSGILRSDIVASMETKSDRLRELRTAARKEIRDWVATHGRGFQRKLANRLGYRPSYISRVLSEGEDEASPSFIRRLAEEYPEWRALWLDYLKMENPQLYGEADASDALESAAARAKDLQLLTELETQIKQAVSRISEIARKHVE